jgi:hypothetical protein
MILDYQNQTRKETDAATIATLNRKGWVERPAEPTITASEIAEWNGTRWTVRPLTSEEQAVIDARTAEATLQQTVKTTLSAILAGTGTQAERVARLERAVHFLAKRMLP